MPLNKTEGDQEYLWLLLKAEAKQPRDVYKKERMVKQEAEQRGSIFHGQAIMSA